MTIGDKIKDSRKKQKITQKRLAEMTGIAEITIRQYELGKYNPKIDNLKKISSALNINIGEFLDTSQSVQEYHTETEQSQRMTYLEVIGMLKEMQEKTEHTVGFFVGNVTKEWVFRDLLGSKISELEKGCGGGGMG